MELDCQRCDEGLVEFLYGELDDKEEAAFRRHLEHCESCSAAAEQLRCTRDLFARLEPEPAPTSFDDAILAAAAARAEELGESRRRLDEAAGQEARSRKRGWLDRIFGSLGAATWRPALGTVVALILVTGAGLMFLRDLPRGTVNEPSPEQLTAVPTDEVRAARPAPRPAPASPSSLIEENQSDAPSEPQTLAQAPEPQARRARNAVSEPEVAAPEPRPPQRRAARGEAARSPQPRHAAGAPPRQNELPAESQESDTNGAGAPLMVDAQPMTGPPPPPSGGEDRAPAPAQAQPSPPASPPVPTPPLPSGAGPVDDNRYRAQQQSPTTSDVDGAQAPTPPRSGSDLYQAGMDAYRAGRYQDAADELNDFVRSPSAPRGLLPSGLHHLALSHQRQGNLGSAARIFDQLLSRYPTYAGRPQAMLEAARVHARMGNLTRAESLLRQLEAIPGWASRAQSEMARIDHRRQSQEGALGPSTPDEAAEEIDDAPAAEEGH